MKSKVTFRNFSFDISSELANFSPIHEDGTFLGLLSKKLINPLKLTLEISNFEKHKNEEKKMSANKYDIYFYKCKN